MSDYVLIGGTGTLGKELMRQILARETKRWGDVIDRAHIPKQ